MTAAPGDSRALPDGLCVAPGTVGWRPAPTQGVVLCLAAVCAVVATATAWPYSPVGVTRTVAAGTYLVAGAIAALRRPDNAVGLLMALVAVGLSVEAVSQGWHLADSAQALLSDISTPLILMLGLAFPTGRWSRAATAVVLAEWLIAVGPPLARMALDDSAAPSNLTSALDSGGDIAEGGVAMLTIAILARRYLTATPPTRRSLRPGYVVGLGCLISGMLVLLADLIGGPGLHATANLAFGILKAALPVSFLVGLLGLQRDRTGALLTGVLGSVTAAQLDRPIQLALMDDSARVLTRPDDRPGPGQQVSPITFEGVLLGRLAHDRALADDPATLRSVTAAAALVLHQQRLREQIESRTAELTAAAGRLVEATDAARRQVERNLHDGAQQRLVAVSIELRLLQAAMSGRGAVQDARFVGAAAGNLEQALRELRTLARGLHPSILTEAGPGSAFRALADRSPVPVQLDAPEDQAWQGLSEPALLTLWYAAAEGLTNVARHARADSVELVIEPTDGGVRLTLTDNGRGGAIAQGEGLRGLRDRARALGGELTIGNAPVRGTRLVMELPR